MLISYQGGKNTHSTPQLLSKSKTFIHSIFSGGEKEYLAYEFPRPKHLISFVFLITTGVFSRGSGIAQVILTLSVLMLGTMVPNYADF
jgi:hypothetical protein